MCQYFVGVVLYLVHKMFPHAYIIHYMYGILLACSTNRELQCLYKYVITCLPAAELKIATEKNSNFAPISIFGFHFGVHLSMPQKNLRTW